MEGVSPEGGQKDNLEIIWGMSRVGEKKQPYQSRETDGPLTGKKISKHHMKSGMIWLVITTDQ